MIVPELRKPNELRARQHVDRRPPFGERAGVDLMPVPPHAHHVLEHVGAVADDRQVDLDVLVDRRRVDVDVDLLRLRRKGVETAGDAVVESCADADHQVAVMHGVVGLERAVHAEHPEPLLVRGRIGAEPHQRRGDRETGGEHEFAQERRGVRSRIDDAAAGVEDRPLGLGHHLDRALHPLDVALDLRMVGLVLDVALERIGPAGELHVLGNVDDDRTRPPVRGDVERLVQDARQVLDAAHQIIVLGAVAGDAGRVAFLERVRADQVGRHLAGDADERNGVHQRVGEAGDRVGRAGPRGDQQHADLAGRARIALGGVRRPPFLTDENVTDLVLVEDRVVDRQHRAAGIAEDELDALILERLDHHFGAGHVLGHCSCPSAWVRRFRVSGIWRQ